MIKGKVVEQAGEDGESCRLLNFSNCIPSLHHDEFTGVGVEATGDNCCSRSATNCRMTGLAILGKSDGSVTIITWCLHICFASGESGEVITAVSPIAGVERAVGNTCYLHGVSFLEVQMKTPLNFSRGVR